MRKQLSFSAQVMDTTCLFQSGRSQAVRLPNELRFTGTEVGVKHFGNGVLLLPLDDPWQTLEAGLAAFGPGFVLERRGVGAHGGDAAEALNMAWCRKCLAPWLRVPAARVRIGELV